MSDVLGLRVVARETTCMTVMLYHSCINTCVTTKVLRIHVEVDNEEGGTIGLFHAVKSLIYRIVHTLHSTKTMQRI